MKSGLERVAEELMGRRKWKHYQDVLTRQQLNLLDPSPNSATTTTTVVDHNLLQSAAAAAAGVAGSNHDTSLGPLTPSMVAAAVAATGGNLLHGGGVGGVAGGSEKGGTPGGAGVGTAAIVRNGHYQQAADGGDLLESKLANNNQQVVATAIAVDKQQLQQQLHPEAAATTNTTTTTATPTTATIIKQNHFNENDSSPTTTTAASSPPPPSALTTTPVNSSPSSSSTSANAVGTTEASVLLTNNHHPATPPHLHPLTAAAADQGDRRKQRAGGIRRSQQHDEEEDEDEDRVQDQNRVTPVTTSPTRSPRSGESAGNSEEGNDQMVVGKLAVKVEPTAENQNNSSTTTPEHSSKLIKQENCNSLLSSKLIINNNNSATNNNNNNINNNISTPAEGGDATPAEVPTAVVTKKPSPPPTPVDWKPQDKCYFCVDGKLLTVNEAGELVPESGPEVRTPASKVELDLVQTLQDSDSDSSDSSEQDLREVLRRQGVGSNKSLAALLRGAAGAGGVPPTMSSLQSMFAAAALQGMQPGLAPFYNPLWYSQLQQQMSPSGSSATAATTPTTDVAGAGVSPTEKGEGVVLGPGGEQPLDLSAKPGGSGLNAAMMSLMDPKHYKAKPRLSPIGGRRTYTEDELQSALHDILNGRLGTRRAAVQYGIPRSTLRNKVYKLAMEHKREMLQSMLVDDDDDKDSVEDGEGGDKDSYQLKLNQQAFAEAYLRMYAGTPKPEPGSAPSTPPQQQPTPEPASASTPTPTAVKPIQTPQKPVTPQSAASAAAASGSNLLDPNMLIQLQSLLLAGGISGGLTNAAKNPEEANAIQTALSVLPELVNKLVQQQELIEQIKKANEPRPSASTPTLNNGQPIDPRLLPYLQQQQNKSRTASGTPETTTSSMDLNDGGSDDSQVILKIPSYKPVPGGSPMPATAAALLATASKNGDHHSLSTPSPPTAPPPTVRDLSSLAAGPSTNSNSSARTVHTASPHSLHPAAQQPVPGSQQQQQQPPPIVNHHHPHHLSSVISPPLGIRPRSNSQSPPSLLGGKSMLSINDVIARSISKNFQQHHQSDLLKQQMEMEQQYKRPTISVIKNLGGTDISRFGRDPNITQMTAAQLAANTGTGGKGTRPKRGKYRNYDRDSLVEAVKAVQRGEMSVHRAGSYYGVPHSTLEYKVKERHLMRPRKREPKPQPGLDGLKSELGGGSSVMRNMDKSKSLAMGASSKAQQMKNQYPGASPNGGLKMPMFDPASMASQLPYGAPFLWPHPAAGFSGLPMDFGRQSAGAAGGAGASGSSANDSIFASSMMQRFQEPQGNKGTALNNSSSGPKTTREIAESIYDGTSTNGSLLDDIIRHSLDKKPGEMSHGALFDQLMKNNSLRTSGAGAASTSSSASLDDPSAALLAKVGAKRSAASPLNFLPETTIKRERASPGASSTSSTSSSKPPNATGFNDHHLHQQQQRHLNTSSSLDGGNAESSRAAELLAQGNLAVESILKMREDLTSLSAAHHHKRAPMEDQHNGGTQQQQQQHHHHQQQLQHHHQQQQQQLLSHRLVTQKLPTAAAADDSS